MQYFGTYFENLLANGYSIVPIAPGEKYPKGINEWQLIDFSYERCKNLLKAQKDLADWGIGIKTGELCAIDMDITESGIIKPLVEWLEKNVGEAPIRIGMHPKCLLLYRAETQQKKIWVEYYNCLKQKQKVEILGQGSQFVAFHTHPDIRQPYFWIMNESPLNIKKADLPIIQTKQLHQFLEYLKEIKPSDWQDKASSSRKTESATEDNDLAGHTPKKMIDITTLPPFLDTISSESYEVWIQVGMALYHEYDGSDEAFQLWNGWSKKSAKYKKEEMMIKWGSFQQNCFKQEPITISTVFYLAKKEGYFCSQLPDKKDSTDLSVLLDKCVYVIEGDKVADFRLPPSSCVMRLIEFKNYIANKKVVVSNGKKNNVVNMHKLWLESDERKTARGCAYAPGKYRLYKDAEAVQWVNTFHYPDHGGNIEPGDASRITLFQEHMEYLFPIPEERTWFLQWMAFTIQKPEIRCKVTPLHITKLHGTGRGFLVELMSHLLGAWNCTNTKMSVLCGEGSNGAFQDFMYPAKFCSIGEVREKNKRYEVNDKIRELLEAPRLELNLKYGRKGTYNVYVNFFLQSNHPLDCLIIPKEDRRIQVLTGAQEILSNAYYKRLYGWMEVADNIHALFRYLNQLDIKNFNFQRCDDTIGRKRLISSNIYLIEKAIMSVIDELKSMNRTSIEKNTLFDKVFSMCNENFNEYKYANLLKEYFSYSSSVSEDGTIKTFWYL